MVDRDYHALGKDQEIRPSATDYFARYDDVHHSQLRLSVDQIAMRLS